MRGHPKLFPVLRAGESEEDAELGNAPGKKWDVNSTA